MTLETPLSAAELRRLGLAILTDRIEMAAFIKDSHGRYVWMNPYGLRLFETSLDALVGRSLSDFIGTAQAEAMTVAEQQVLRLGKPDQRVEHMVLRASDERRSFRTVRIPIQHAQRVVGLCGYSQEITGHLADAASLLDSKSLLDNILNHLPALIYIKDWHGAYLYANQMTLQDLGHSLGEVIGKTDFDLVDVASAQRFRAMDEEVLTSRQSLEREETLRTNNGLHKHYLSFKLPLELDEKKPLLLGFSTEITNIKRTQEALAQSEARFRALFEASSEAVILMTPERFIDCNPAALRLFGLPGKEEFLGFTPADLAPEKQACGTPSQERAMQIIAETVAQRSYRTEIIIQRWDTAEQIPVEIVATALDIDHELLLMVTLRDFSEHRKQIALIERMALYDPLTDLPNRKLLKDRMQVAIAALQRQHRHAALMFLDLDNFKPLNDRYGHQAGDLLLREVGSRLKRHLRAEDTVARQGGDEFIVLLVDLDESRLRAELHALKVAEKLRHELQYPYSIELQPGRVVEHHCSCSVGVTVFGPGETSIDDVLQRADHAMYRAKAKGRNCVRLSLPSFRS
ncbi:diguanylate cyclase domain-containing protein [Giesbergeria sinuosa]|uniref:Diguanylate cyclase domain-containing protein n=1 Tax=Giesbergeria sinuosa TaxID=80883 RepID=A0ABV9QBE9_9BURK